jgi:hypothetical protein
VALGDLKSMYEAMERMVPEMKGPSFEEMVKNMFG